MSKSNRLTYAKVVDLQLPGGKMIDSPREIVKIRKMSSGLPLMLLMMIPVNFSDMFTL